jgi:16S rRNA processing protein RimM
MDLSQCYYLGYVSRVTGSKGRCEIKLDVDQPSDYKKLESVLILMNSKDLTPIPFFIQQVVALQGNQIQVELIENQSITDLSVLKGKQVYLPLSSLKPLSGKAFYFHEIMGFTVNDKSHGAIGTVQDVYDMPSNPILSVKFEEKEILIPLRDEILLRVDREKKVLEIDAPEGLIELYLD